MGFYMKFSKLDDEVFPNAANVNTYALHNEFDYTRWIAGTQIRLVNVLWDSDYRNVVKFDSKDEMNKWFDSVAGSESITLQSNVPLVPSGTIKLPIPYDVCVLYNYIYVDIPIIPDPANPIDYEVDGKRRWYFFIKDEVPIAPNTTELILDLDIWNNFIYDTDINYLMLDRGHAPVAFSDTDEYLKNPIENNKYLLAPDVNFDDTSVTKDSTFIPFGNGEKYICVCSTVSPEQIRNGVLGTLKTGDVFSKPTYSNTGDWYGKQLQVNGYKFGDGRNFSDLRTAVSMGNTVDKMLPTGLCTYAIPANDSTFLDDVANSIPTFLRTIKALFIVDENMVNIGNPLTIAKHTIYECSSVAKDVMDYDLDKYMFKFDKDEERFAKLYTYPYSYIEVTDNNDKTVTVRIEDTGTIGVHLLTSVAYPVLDCRVFLSGINGVGSNEYSWKRLDYAEVKRFIPKGDWGDYTFKLGIPTFSMFMDAETAWMLDEYNTVVELARKKALTAYHNAVRDSNLGYTNAINSADNAYKCSVDSAETACTNEKDLAKTANTNAHDTASTVHTNRDAEAYTTKSNTTNTTNCNYNNLTASIACNNANTTTTNETNIAVTELRNSQATGDTNESNEVNSQTVAKENETSIATTTNNNNANINNSVSQGAIAGATMGVGNPVVGSVLALTGAVTGWITSSRSAEAASNNASLMTQCNDAVSTAIRKKNYNSNVRAVGAAKNVTIKTNDNNWNQTRNNNDLLTKQRDNNYNTNIQNIANTYNTDTANNQRTHQTAIDCADRTMNTVIANANRTRDTAVSNATSTKNTSYKNAGNTNEIGILNAKETLETAQDGARLSMMSASKKAPIQLTQTSGDASMYEYGMNGVQFKLRTQSDSAIKQTVAQFARFGYNLNQVWDVKETGLTLMKNFTFWKVNDIWLDIRKASNFSIENGIVNIFKNGVTIWNNPNKIGKVSIYDN